MFDQHSLTTRRLFFERDRNCVGFAGQGKDVALQEARGWRASERPPNASRGKETPAVTAIAPNLILDLHHRHHHARIAATSPDVLFFRLFFASRKTAVTRGHRGVGLDSRDAPSPCHAHQCTSLNHAVHASLQSCTWSLSSNVVARETLDTTTMLTIFSHMGCGCVWSTLLRRASSCVDAFLQHVECHLPLQSEILHSGHSVAMADKGFDGGSRSLSLRNTSSCLRARVGL
jgi:hypothetical protein